MTKEHGGNVLDMSRHGGRHNTPRTRDTELERQVIGAVLGDPKVFAECATLDASAFSDRVHARLWNVVTSMIMAGRTVSPSTLAVELGPEGLDYIGGRAALDAMTEAGSKLAPNVAGAAERLREAATWRNIQNLANRMQEMSAESGISADDALSTIISEAESALTAGRPTARGKREVARTAIDTALQSTDPVPTGISSLDYLLHGGLIQRRMTGVGAPTGTGKTILSGTISENLNAIGEPHLFISLETPPEDIEIRNVARRLNANAAQIIDSGTRDHKLLVHNAQRYIDQVPDKTLFEYQPGATVDAVHRTIVQAAHRDGIKGFILDSWQLVQGKQRGQSMEEHLRAVAHRLATICRKENLWGIVTGETDGYGRLKLSDGLRTHSSIYMRLERDEGDVVVTFRTEKSNYTRYGDTSASSVPGTIFSEAGPHYADPAAEDVPQAMADEVTGGEDLNLQ